MKSIAKKSGTSEIAYQARQFTRLLSKATRSPVVIEGSLITNVLELEGVTIWICALTDYPTFSDAEQNIRSDRKILHVSGLLSRKHDNVAFCSVDGMCSLRAGEAMGLKTYEHRLVEETTAEFIRYLTVSEAVFSQLHDSLIIDVDPDYRIENYNYVFSTEGTTQRKLATLSNGLIKVVGKVTEDEIRKQDLGPMNAGQLFLSKAILDPTIDIVVCDAKAGSGKTAVALSSAIKLVMDGKYESITYIRTSVDDLEKAEEIGFLSGNNEKWKSIFVHLKILSISLLVIVLSLQKTRKMRSWKKVTETLRNYVLAVVSKV